MKRAAILFTALILAAAAFNALPLGGDAHADGNSQREGKTLLRRINGLSEIKGQKNEPIEPSSSPLSADIFVRPKTRAEMIESRKAGSFGQFDYYSAIAPSAIPKGVPSNQVVITSDFRSRSNSGGAVLALRDSNNDGIADQQAVLASDIVESGDAITKIIPSRLSLGRYYAITENTELIQIFDDDGDYSANDVIAYDDFTSSSGLGIALASAILDDGSEAVYLMKIEPGNDGFFYTSDDTAHIAVFLDRNRNGEFDAFSRFFNTRPGFTSLGGFSIGVETSLLFSLGQYDNGGRVLNGSIFSYYDFNGDGIHDDFSSNNRGIFAEGTTADSRPAIASEIVQSGTDFYVTSPLRALGISGSDDITIYSDLNASQVSDRAPVVFATVQGLNGFSSDLSGLAVSLDGKRVAMARNQISSGDVQGSRILFLFDENYNGKADREASELFNNGISGLGGVCFSNADLRGPQPIIVFPRLKSTGKFVLDAIGAQIAQNAVLISDGREQFSMKLNNTRTKWIVSPSVRSVPSGLSVSQVLGSGSHTLTIKNPSGQQSLPVFFKR